jgi:hypothetical protein
MHNMQVGYFRLHVMKQGHMKYQKGFLLALEQCWGSNESKEWKK